MGKIWCDSSITGMITRSWPFAWNSKTAIEKDNSQVITWWWLTTQWLTLFSKYTRLTHTFYNKIRLWSNFLDFIQQTFPTAYYVLVTWLTFFQQSLIQFSHFTDERSKPETFQVYTASKVAELVFVTMSSNSTPKYAILLSLHNGAISMPSDWVSDCIFTHPMTYNTVTNYQPEMLEKEPHQITLLESSTYYASKC